MNNIIKYGSIDGNPLYNCSAHTPEEWSERGGVRRPIFGILDLSYGLVVNAVYIPILGVMLKSEHFKLSCFKIMFFLGLVDMLAIGVNSIITGFLAIQGAVFCTYPTFIYLSGMIGLGLWCGSCMIALLLVLNRILDLANKRICEIFFDDYRTYIVLILPIIYASYFIFFTIPPAFSSKYMTWLYDPLIFPNQTNQYANLSHGFNNLLVVAITCLFYAFFYFSFRNKLKEIKSGNSKAQMMSANIFFQSSLICIVNQVASIIYVFMNFIEVPLWVIMSGHMLWQFGHGVPIVIYLTMNRTIRNELLRMMGCKKYLENRNRSKTSGLTASNPTVSVHLSRAINLE